METMVTFLVSKRLLERANALFLGVLWSAFAVCVVAALSYDVLYWLGAW